MSRGKIPDFKDVDDMAQFWESHDTEDFQHHGVEAVNYRWRRVVLSVRFDPGHLVALTRAARRSGVDRSTSVRMMVRKQLLAEHEDQAGHSRGLSREGASLADGWWGACLACTWR